MTPNALAFRARQIPIEIDNALSQAVDETGEIVDENALQYADDLLKEKTVTLADLGGWILWANETRLGEIDALIDRLKREKKRVEKGVEICKTAIKYNLPVGEKVETDFVKIGWRKSSAVVVDCDPESLPEQYQIIKVTITANKTELEKAIESGERIDGVSIETRHHLQVK